MYPSHTINDEAYDFENIAPLPSGYPLADSWDLQNTEADALGIPEHMSLDFATDVPLVDVFGAQFDETSYQTSYTGGLPDDGNTELEQYTAFDDIEGFRDGSPYFMPTPEIPTTYPFELPTQLLPYWSGGHARSLSIVSEFGWGSLSPESTEGSATSFCASPTTISTSELGAPSSMPVLSRRSNSSPPARSNRFEDQPHKPSTEIPKHPISPSKHSRTFSQERSRAAQCEDCGRSFTLRKDLARHSRSIHVRQRFLCPVPGCRYGNEGFPRKDKLLQHLRTHSETERAIAQHRSWSDYSLKSESVASGDSDNTFHHPKILGTAQTWPLNNRDVTPGSHSDLDTKSTAHGTNQPYSCSIPGCGRSFVNQHDLGRHSKTVHMNQDAGEGYRCAFVGCTKTDKIWTRLDNFKNHLKKQHGVEQVDELVQKSARVNSSSNGNVPFAVTTPQMFSQNKVAKRHMSAT